jgi:solute:Na+ symporter, SSS family
MNWLDWTALCLYVVVLISIALWHSRKIVTRDDVYLAGRSMSRWPIAMSMYMAIFSTNTFLGVTGWVNRPDGSVWIGLQPIGIILAAPVVIWLFPTMFYRLRITTAYEYLEMRFNRSTRWAATVFFLGARLMWMATMSYSASLVAARMAGQSQGQGVNWGAIALCALGTALAFTGGMHAVIWTDVVQFFIFFAAVALMVFLGIANCGGLENVLAIGSQHGRFAPPPLAGITQEFSMLGVLLMGFVGMLSSSGADQVVLQTYLTAKSDKEAKRALWRNALFLKPLSLIYPFLGLIIFAYFQIHPGAKSLMRHSDDALPVFVMNVLPHGVRGLMVVAILTAVLTSLESGMAALSAVVQTHLFSHRAADAAQSVRLARIIMVASGVIVAAAALWVETLGRNIVQILNIVMYPFSGVLLGIFLLGVLVRRANGAGALIGAVAGFLVTVAIPLSGRALPLIDAWSPGMAATVRELSRVSTFYFGFLGAVATVVFGYLASLCYPPPVAGQLEGLTHWSLKPESDET